MGLAGLILLLAWLTCLLCHTPPQGDTLHESEDLEVSVCFSFSNTRSAPKYWLKEQPWESSSGEMTEDFMGEEIFKEKKKRKVLESKEKNNQI